MPPWIVTSVDGTNSLLATAFTCVSTPATLTPWTAFIDPLAIARVAGLQAGKARPKLLASDWFQTGLTVQSRVVVPLVKPLIVYLLPSPLIRLSSSPNEITRVGT